VNAAKIITNAQRADLVVVGGGTAAYAVAIAARQFGVGNVVMLEKAPPAEAGGNPRFSHSGFRWVQGGPEEIRGFLPDLESATFDRMEFRSYSAEDFHDDLRRATRGAMDQELTDILVSESNAALHWLLDLGLRWAPENNVEVDGRLYFEPGYSVHPRGGGLGQLAQLNEMAESMHIDVRYESRVSALLGSVRAIDGVRVSTPDGEYELSAPIVVLCSGGFQASPEMRARYLGPNADLMKVRGSRHNTGEVLQMALALGAAASGHWQGAHASVVDFHTPPFGILGPQYNRYSYPYGISVNTLGVRFCDEGADLRMHTYAKMGWTVLKEPEGLAWQIFDQRTLNDERGATLRGAYEHASERQEAETIRELAELIRVVPEVLEDTIRRFNAACSDDVPFDPTVRDGKRTQNLVPPKSNWANPIDAPPFVAFPVTAGITFTFGGLQINKDAQVLDTGGHPIKGLYASGDIVGLFYHGYVGSTGQTRNVVFSRRAAGHAFG
jgi:tricarballylate dehydrogenase